MKPSERDSRASVAGAAASGDLPAASLVLYEPPWPLPGRTDHSAVLDAMDARIAAGDPEGAREAREDRDALARVVGAGPGRVVAVVGGDDQSGGR